MNKAKMIDAKLLRMLELLANGASTQTLAREMGYSEGTVRVYLHNLYRHMGVRNRTQAVLRYIKESRPAAESPGQAPAPPHPSVPEGSFGAAALDDGLRVALGVMESFLGPYARVWEVGLRLKGQAIDAESATRRREARVLWRALLAGDFGAAKRAYDEGVEKRLARASPWEMVLLVLMLQLGGFSHAAETVLDRLRRGARSSRIGARDMELLRSVGPAAYAGDAAALASIQRLAGAATPLGHVAAAVLFQIFRQRRDFARAAAIADALWSQAETARAELEAMGERPFAPRAAASATPSRASSPAAAAARENAAAPN